MELLDEPLEVITADGVMFGTHYGEVHLHVKAGNNVTHDLVLNNVIYVATLQANFISVTTLYDHGYEFAMIPGKGAEIRHGGELVSGSVREGHLFRLNIPVLTTAKLVQADEEEELKAEDVVVWHRRLAHLGIGDVRKLEKRARGIKITGGSQLGVCGDCLAGKQHRHPCHEPSMRTTVPANSSMRI